MSHDGHEHEVDHDTDQTHQDTAVQQQYAAGLRLLWGAKEPGRRGPKPKLELDEIVNAAVRVADGEGLEGLSMRRVAKELDVGTMSLYRYVPSKEALLDLMFDTACGEAAAVDEVPGGWRAKLEFEVRQSWELYQRHPWLLQVPASRPALGPNVMRQYEALLDAVSGVGLTEREMVAVANMLDSYTRGLAHMQLTSAAVERQSGVTDYEWWQSVEPVLEEVIDWDRYPVSSQVAANGAYDDGGMPYGDFSFEFGLQRILDGIEALVHTRRSDRHSRQQPVPRTPTAPGRAHLPPC